MSPQQDANAEAEWQRVLDYVAEHGSSLESSAMVEDFIDLHVDQFVEQIEVEAGRNTLFAELVATANLGDMSGPGAERIARLQDELFERGDLGVTRWQGYIPLTDTKETS